MELRPITARMRLFSENTDSETESKASFSRAVSLMPFSTIRFTKEFYREKKEIKQNGQMSSVKNVLLRQ